MWKKLILNYISKKLPTLITSSKLHMALLGFLTVKLGLPEEMVTEWSAQVLAALATAVPLIIWIIMKGIEDGKVKAAKVAVGENPELGSE